MGQERGRGERGNGGKDQQRWVQRRDWARAREIDVREREKEVGRDRLLKTCLKIKVWSWPRLIFHHTPKLNMWTVITYLSNCLTSKGGCHTEFTKGQRSQQAGRKGGMKECWSHQMPGKTTLLKGHLLEMELLGYNTKWRWHDLKYNIWKGFDILIPHTFMAYMDIAKI